MSKEYNDVLNQLCTISYDDDAECIIMTWKTYASSQQLRLIYERFLELVIKKKVKKAISDTRLMVMLSAEDQMWIVEELVPRLQAAGLRYSAIIVPLNHFAMMGVDNVVKMVGQDEIQTKYFKTVEDALNWFELLS